jgi:hypothetical protein
VPTVVALTELTDVDGRVIGCPAAPMVAGELRRRGNYDWAECSPRYLHNRDEARRSE